QAHYQASLSMSPQNTAPPTISGNPIALFQLTASPGTWVDPTGGTPSFAYDWQRCSSDDTCSDTGSTGATYQVANADIGYAIQVTVTATSPAGSTTVSSALTPAVQSAVDAFAPQLRYDSRETFYADSAAEITDNCDFVENDNNQLKNTFEEVIASPCPGSSPLLSLDYLGPSYSDGLLASSNDHINEADNYQAD